MSDEYHNKGYKNTLVDDSVTKTGVNLDEATKNYPPQGGDCTSPKAIFHSSNYAYDEPLLSATSSGGYGSADTSKSLIDQSTNGGNLKGEIQDAKQGIDEETRRAVS
ncbi:hypothetical protein VNI00_002876 [Paramarasmius palmivorus]|uniref:Uncharacterized protein n=1 Tax=Paramarasmius palmivorus TaxID=297713 RepID=A0AAW0DYS9_9AGAR